MSLRFGASYYHEYMPYERLDRDVELMRAAGFTTVRVGESTWASWEPRDGEFRFDWMERVLDRLHGAGIEVILGTPSYAIPPWLARAHPEVMAQASTGVSMAFGARQNTDLLNPTYRRHVERAIRQIVGHFAQHPAVAGYQLDNETGMFLLHNDDVFAAFVDHLRSRYRDVEDVNEAWGLTYWSQRLSCWEDLWRPDGNTNPGYYLAWRRFQATVVTGFLAWQAGIVRELARPDQYVTHDFVGGHGVAGQDRHLTTPHLDFPSENIYCGSQEGLMLPASPLSSRYVPEWMVDSGVWDLFTKADISRGCSQRFLVTEASAGSIWNAHLNHPPYPGQLALVAHALLARGATGVMYWHWHTCHQGSETFWHGVLGHDLEPGRIYDEVAELGRTFAAYGDRLDGWTPDAHAALLYSMDSRYAMQFQPPLRVADTNQPDPGSYVRLLTHYLRSGFDARLPMAVLHPEDRWSDHPVVIAPGLYVADDRLMEQLRDYVEGGGHLVVSLRTGGADEHNRARWTRAPHQLRAVAGVSLQEYSHLAEPLPLAPAPGSPVLAGDNATQWADGLLLEGAEVLAGYVHPFHGRFPAVTTHRYGRGRLTYLGTVPDAAATSRLLRWVAHQAGIPAPWGGIPEEVRVDGGVSGRGERLWFVGNWSWQPARVVAPMALFELDGSPVGSEITVGPLGVRLLSESGRQG